MSWAATKTALAERLTGLAITSPVAEAIRRVFTEPPRSIEPGDVPAIAFGESTLEDNWGASEALEDYLLTGYVLLSDESTAQGVLRAEAYREALKNAFRQNLTLLAPTEEVPASAVIAAGPSFSQLGSITFAGKTYPGFMFQLPISLNVTVTFAGGDE